MKNLKRFGQEQTSVRVYGFYSSDSSDSFRCATSQNEILFMEVVFTRHMKNIIKITEILSRIYSFRQTRSQNEILFMEVVFTRHLKKIIKTTGIISIRHKVEIYSLISQKHSISIKKLHGRSSMLNDPIVMFSCLRTVSDSIYKNSVSAAI